MRPLLTLVSAVLVVLDAAAFHDILVREPDLRAEWTMLAGSLVILGVLGLWAWRNRPHQSPEER